jgi:hypothetical protein
MTSILQAVDFDLSSKPSVSGLVPLTAGRTPLNDLAEEVAVREAEAIAELDYVFFRRFADGRSSQVAAYVIDNSDGDHTEHDLAFIHKAVWLNGTAPLLYVAWPTRVDILSCARGADFWQPNQADCKYQTAERIPVRESLAIAGGISDELRKRFSALRLSDGTFWDDPQNSNLADVDKSAHRLLIQAVIDADGALDGKNKPVLRRLLLLTILIKYLEDRGVFQEEPNWFSQFHQGAKTFQDILDKGTPDEVKRLLSALETKFNGDVFTLPDDNYDLTQDDLSRVLSTLIEGKTIKQQRCLWEQFSFRYLPIEVLSHLYQHFAKHGTGASLLLDFALPYNQITGKERILDPTCGSGVFLVGAFRRLVHQWRSQHQWRQPTVTTLKSILENNIFGVELDGDSLHLTAFSLALAVCDALQPNVIWRDLQFEKLVGPNLVENDFFIFLSDQAKNPKASKFDVILGNPPFLSKLTNEASNIDKGEKKRRGTLPDKQIAYLVTEQAFKLLTKETGRLCLIQPSGLIYNEKARKFHRYLMQSHRTDFVLDFASVRGLFSQKGNTKSQKQDKKKHTSDTKIVVWVATETPPNDNHQVRHLTFRRTFSVKEQIGFELDHYDYHVIPQKQMLSAPYSWKVNLLGGGRLHLITARLKQMGTIKGFLATKKKKQNWDYGEGYIAAETGKRDEEDWLTGKPLLPSQALNEHGINKKLLKTVEETHFRSAYTTERYEPPLMLIRENAKLQCAFWENGFLAYKAKIVGIHAPKSQRKELWEFFNAFKNARAALQAICLIESTQLLIGRATAPLKRDIDNLPWPETGESWDLASWEQVMCNDLVEHMAPFVRLGQDSLLLKNPANDSHLQEYAALYCDMLGSIYQNLECGQSFRLNGLICQSFHFGNEPHLNWSEDWATHLEKLVYGEWGQTIRTVRMVRFYESNVIMIVKPDRLRYWIPSTAIRDADDTLAYLIRQGF